MFVYVMLHSVHYGGNSSGQTFFLSMYENSNNYAKRCASKQFLGSPSTFKANYMVQNDFSRFTHEPSFEFQRRRQQRTAMCNNLSKIYFIFLNLTVILHAADVNKYIWFDSTGNRCSLMSNIDRPIHTMSI